MDPKMFKDPFDIDENHGKGRCSGKDIFAHLTRYLKPDGALSLKEVVEACLAMLPGADEWQGRMPEMALFAKITFDVAQQIPYDSPLQVKLVRLMEVLSRLAKLSYSRLSGYGVAEWTSFELMGGLWGMEEEIRDWYGGSSGLEDDEDGRDPVEMHLNFVAFLARLLDARVFGLRPVVFAQWSCCKGLEERWAPEQQDIEIYSCFVSAAAIWVILAGRALFDAVVEPGDYVNSEPLGRPGELFDGPTIGRARWDFWKKRFMAVCDDAEVDEESMEDEKADAQKVDERCKSLCRRAISIMNGVDGTA